MQGNRCHVGAEIFTKINLLNSISGPEYSYGKPFFPAMGISGANAASFRISYQYPGITINSMRIIPFGKEWNPSCKHVDRL